jgi:hypothetical protein
MMHGHVIIIKVQVRSFQNGFSEFSKVGALAEDVVGGLLLLCAVAATSSEVRMNERFMPVKEIVASEDLDHEATVEAVHKEKFLGFSGVNARPKHLGLASFNLEVVAKLPPVIDVRAEKFPPGVWWNGQEGLWAKGNSSSPILGKGVSSFVTRRANMSLDPAKRDLVDFAKGVQSVHTGLHQGRSSIRGEESVKSCLRVDVEGDLRAVRVEGGIEEGKSCLVNCKNFRLEDGGHGAKMEAGSEGLAHGVVGDKAGASEVVEA